MSTTTKDTTRSAPSASVPEKKPPSKLESYLNKKNLSTTSSPSTGSLNKYGSNKDLQDRDTKRSPAKYGSSSTNNLTSIGSESRASQRNLAASNLSDSDKNKTNKYLSNRDLRKETAGVESPKTSRFATTRSTKAESPTPRYGSTSKLSTESARENPRYGSQYSLGSNYGKKIAEENGNKPAAKKSEGPPITYNTLYGRSSAAASDKKGNRSRDPSPKMTRPLVTINRGRSRDPSPLKSSSRESSPVGRFGGTTSGFSSNNPNSYTNRFRNAISPFNQRPTPSSSSNLLLSYMTNREAALTRRYSPSKSKEPSDVDKTLEEIKHLAEDIDRVLKVEEEEVIMVQVNVVHRATSPNPATGTSTRTRRLDISKTVSKTIERPLKKPEMIDKEIQSDRMDDSTKYSRFNPSSARAASTPSWSPEVKKNATPTTPITKSRTDSVEGKSPSLTKSNSIKNLTRSESKKSLSRSDSAKKSASSSSKSNKSEGKSLPPTAPTKADSPVKVLSNSVNKDFRKSALNMGPTDRLRKARGSQSSIESGASNKSGIVCNHHTRSERSQSVGSETGGSSSSLPSSACGTPDPQRAKSSQSAKATTARRKYSEKTNSTDTSSSVTGELPIDNLSDICLTVTHNPNPNLSTTNANATTHFVASNGVSVNESGAKNEHHVHGGVVVDETTRRSPSQFEQSSAVATSASSSSSSSSSGQAGLSTVAKIFYQSVSPQQRPHPLPAVQVIASPEDQQQRNYLTTTEDLDLEPNTEATSLRYRCDSTSVSESLRLDTEPPSGLGIMGVRECSEVSTDRSWFDKGHSDQPLELKADLVNKLRHIDSGDRSTWLASNGSKSHSMNVPSVEVSAAAANGNREENNFENGNGEEEMGLGCENSITIASAYKIRHIESGESAWWMAGSGGGSRNSPSGSASSADKTNNRLLTNGNSTEEKNSEVNGKFKIPHVKSGEKAWWMSPTPEAAVNGNGNSQQPTNGTENNHSKYKLRHVESGEKAWWAKSDSDSASATVNNKTNGNKLSSSEEQNQSKYIIRPIESGERAWWMTTTENEQSSAKRSMNRTEDDISEVEEDEEFEQIIIDSTLGDRASPEGVEDPRFLSQNRLSPYDNVDSIAHKQLQKNAANLFISKHTNIDDVLGGNSTLQQAR